MLKDDGTVLAWGENKFGQLAINPESAVNVFVPSQVFSDDSLVKVYAGWTHTAALTKDGEVF